MGFFANFSAWLNALLATYIGDNTARIAAALEPAMVTMAVLYLLVWGFLQLYGRVEEPVMDGLKRIVIVALVIGIGLHLWGYNEVIVETFFNAPAQLGAVIVGAPDSVGIVDQILFDGADAGNALMAKAGIFDGNWAYYFAGAAVYLAVGITAIYTIFLLSLSRIALSILLALGPLFITLFFFVTTRRFVEAWLAQLANYAFVAILTTLAAALMLTLVSSATAQATEAGGDITLALAARVCFAAGLTFLVMRQVMPMAAGLASGIALSTYGVISGALSRGGGLVSQFARGTLDRETSRWDSMARKGGYYARRGLRGVVTAPVAAARSLRRNSIRASS